MFTLEMLLDKRSFRSLSATAHAHGLGFNSKRAKRHEQARLYLRLTLDGVLKQTFKKLQAKEKRALQVLQACGGTMPLYEFTRQFGEIRKYRPWRADSPRHAWRHPISTAEKLWFLGFIETFRGYPPRVMAPVEVLDLLPPLPRPISAAAPAVASSGVDRLRVSIGLWLGYLMAEDSRPIWGRWLPLMALRAINQRLSLPENLDMVRSELQSQRLRFFHYIAHVSGLVALAGGCLKPAPAAWQWLELSPEKQWEWLWRHWNRDMQRRDGGWHIFRYPEFPHWKVLVEQLEKINGSVDRASFIESLAPYLENIPPELHFYLDTLLTWSGWLTADEQTITRSAPGFAPVEFAPVTLEADGLWIDLPENPPLRALVEISAVATVDAQGWRITGTTDAESTAKVLMQFTGRPVSAEIMAQLKDWETNGLVLRQMTVLTAPDAKKLATLRQNRHLRGFFSETLSAHHVAVRGQTVHELHRRLEQRGHPVTAHLPPDEPPPVSFLTAEMATYFWIAIRTYQAMGNLIDLPVTIPGAVSDWLAAQIPSAQMENLHQNVQTVRQNLAETIEGRHIPPSTVEQTDPLAVRIAVEQAYQQRASLTIEYLSPMQSMPLRRTIEPLTPLVEENGAVYFDAWCPLAGASRTFRLDRIYAVSP